MRTRSPTRVALLRRAAALAALTAASFPASARADDAAISAGVYVSFTFGKQLGVGYGGEASLVGLTTGEVGVCGPRNGLGGLVQVGGINGSTLKMVAAAEGGGTFSDEESPALVGELGLAAHVAAEDPGVGLHTGLLFDTGRFANLFFRSEWLLDEYSVGSGARLFGTFGFPGCAVAGRPLRTALGAPRAAREAAPTTARDDDFRALAQAWAEDAQAECASIPAFLQLALDLLVSGAPVALVAAALDAAEDEIRHAQACAAMASRWLEEPFRPSLPDEPLRASAAGPALVARLAIESWLDGALSEGAAAARAAAAASFSADGRSRALQRRHLRRRVAPRRARLACPRVGAGPRRRGGRRGVRGHRDVHVPTMAGPPIDPRIASAYGRLCPSEDLGTTASHARRARQRLDGLLAA